MNRPLRLRFILVLTAAAAAGIVAVAALSARLRGNGPGAEALTLRALQAVRTRQWAAADAALDQLASLHAPTAAETILRAEVRKGQGKPDDALALLGRVPPGDPLAAQVLLMSAQIERGRDRLRVAEERLLAALKLDPNLVQARRELVYLYGMQARRDDLAAQFEALSKIGRLSFEDVFLWTTSNQDIWANTAIEADLRRFLKADPDDRKSRVALASVLLAAGKLDEAESVASPLPDADVEALAVRIQIAMRRSQWDQTEALLRRAPGGPPLLSRLRGELAMRRDDWPAAVRELTQAMQADPAGLQAAQSLALALKHCGKSAEAETVQERAARLRALGALLPSAHPPEALKDRTIARRMGQACEAAGLNAVARSWYRLAIEFDPLDAASQKAVFRLGGTSG